MKSIKSKVSRPVIPDETKERLARVLNQFLKENCEHLDWFSESCALLRNRNWAGLYALADRLSAAVHETANKHLLANQFAALILKCPLNYKDLGLEVDPETKAMEKFIAAEHQCEASNLRLRSWDCVSNSYRDNIFHMRKWIRNLLGDEPDLEAIFSLCSFSSGASIGIHGNATHLGRKVYDETWTVTLTAVPYFLASLGSNFHLSEYLCENRNGVVCFDTSHVRASALAKMKYVSFNKLSFVPKTAKTHRSIAVEPLLNSYLQKGIDEFLRFRLKLWNYNLSDQGRNQRLAREGSLTGSLATIDLSSASDSISIELCKMLLPDSWFRFLDRTRSPAYLLSDGVERRYHKFVSMGNGFCFPLETLIFAAAVRSCLINDENKQHAVYGDDIIISTDSAELLLGLLKYLGFSPNDSKTFLQGNFRESCGSDWYRGQDVRPVYLDFPLNKVHHLMGFHNATLRSGDVADLFSRVRQTLRDWVPGNEKLLRPPFGQPKEYNGFDPLDKRNQDGAFTVPLDVFMHHRHARWNKSQQRWSWKEFVYKPLPDPRQDLYPIGRYIAFLLGSQGGRLNLRRKTKRLIIVR